MGWIDGVSWPSLGKVIGALDNVEQLEAILEELESVEGALINAK